MSQEKPPNPAESTEKNRIAWHPAFVEALQLELEQYLDVLEFTSEYQLASEPLRIDVLVVKKVKDVVIKKNIAAIFRKDNIVEYKSPGDYVSVADFYQVYGYACFYAAVNKASITDLSLTFVESRLPRELLEHLRKVRRYRIVKRQPGIYSVEGDILPIQLIDSRKLSVEENIWLRDLDDKLKAPDIERVMREIRRRGKGGRFRAYLDVVFRANPKSIKEAVKMLDVPDVWEEIIEETGLAAKWEAKGREQGSWQKQMEIARNLKDLDLSDNQIITATGLSAEEVAQL